MRSLLHPKVDFAVWLLLAVAGCSSSRARHKDPEAAVARCREALLPGDPAGSVPRMVAGCADIFVEPRCREAWQAMETSSPSERATKLAQMIRVCGEVYCPLLPQPCPEDWGAMQQAILALDLGKERAETLVNDIRATLSAPKPTRIEVPPPADCAAEINLVVSKAGVWIFADDVRFVADCPTGPDVVAIGDELCRLGREERRSCQTAIQIGAEPDAAHARVVALMDVAVQTGYPQVALGDPAPKSGDVVKVAAICGGPTPSCKRAGAPVVAELPAPDRTTVTIDADGGLLLGDKRLASLDELTAALKAHPQRGAPSGSAGGGAQRSGAQLGRALVLAADHRTPSQRVNEVMRAAYAAGFTDIQFAVRKP